MRKLTCTTLAAIVLLSCHPLLAQRGGRSRGGPLGPRIEPEDLKSDVGAGELADRAAFDRFSYKGSDVGRDGYLANLQFVKFCIDKADTDNHKIYFMNTHNHRAHPPFMQMVGISTRERGAITYLPRLTNPSGESGLYSVDFEPRDSYSFEEIDDFLKLLTKFMPILKGRVAFHPLQGNVARYESEKQKYQAAGVAVHLDSDLFRNISFLPLNSAEAYGLLRLMDADGRPTSRDVVIYRTLPNQMPRVSGVMTEVRQTPLSHVNLRAIQDGTPNAFIKGASDIDDIKSLIGKLVHFKVTAQGYKLREATKGEVDRHLEELRPTKFQTPVRNLDVEEVKPLGEITFAQSDSFGVKTANLATLRSTKMPAGVPDGFGVPFFYYDEFMKHNGFYELVDQTLTMPEFGENPDRGQQIERLKQLRTRIENGKMPNGMLDAFANVQKQFSNGTSIRCRSSTNSEDLPGFSGAGLYDSYTHKPDEGHLAKSIKQVYASLWNFRAFEEREFHRIDHKTTAMGVLLLPNFKGEKANGVAVTDDVLYETNGNYYLNTQIGEDLVTNPDQTSSPEEILLGWWKEDGRQVVRRSSAATNNELLLSESHLSDMRASLAQIHGRFAKLYGRSADDELFAMEVEFKITKDGELVIKQARPWVFNVQ
ncbi:MAG: PEP/pyruvate-binding domain-containing protein [Fuerstiella sp.]